LHRNTVGDSPQQRADDFAAANLLNYEFTASHRADWIELPVPLLVPRVTDFAVIATVLRPDGQAIAERAAACDLAARYGGEEFVVMSLQTEAAGVSINTTLTSLFPQRPNSY
jgi:hypothetical protein